MDDARFLSELRRYWDEIPRGELAAPDDLDPDVAAVIRALHALRDVPEPDPIFAGQLRENLMNATTLSLPRTDSLLSPGHNGWAVPLPRRVIVSPLPVTHGRWTLTRLATAVLLLLVLAGSMLVFSPDRPGRQGDTPLVLPAISGTPATAETVATETLVDVPVDDLPTGTGTASVVRWTLEPGPQPLLFPAQTGPRFFVVEAGEVTATEADVEHRLAAGDIYVAADPEEEVAIHVSGPETVSLLGGFVSHARRDPAQDPEAHDHLWLIDGVFLALPGGSGRLILEQLMLPPGSALPALEARPFDWFEVGDGTLGVTLEGDDLPVGWPAGEERTFRVGNATTDAAPPGTRMTLRNAGDDPLILYRLTLTPSDAGTTGAGTPVP